MLLTQINYRLDSGNIVMVKLKPVKGNPRQYLSQNHLQYITVIQSNEPVEGSYGISINEMGVY